MSVLVIAMLLLTTCCGPGTAPCMPRLIGNGGGQQPSKSCPPKPMGRVIVLCGRHCDGKYQR